MLSEKCLNFCVLTEQSIDLSMAASLRSKFISFNGTYISVNPESKGQVILINQNINPIPRVEVLVMQSSDGTIRNIVHHCQVDIDTFSDGSSDFLGEIIQSLGHSYDHVEVKDKRVKQVLLEKSSDPEMPGIKVVVREFR